MVSGKGVEVQLRCSSRCFMGAEIVTETITIQNIRKLDTKIRD